MRLPAAGTLGRRDLTGVADGCGVCRRRLGGTVSALDAPEPEHRFGALQSITGLVS